MKKLWKEDLVPYRTMRRELPFVMVSHARVSPDHQRTHACIALDKWITDILRKKIGYRGLICSDDLEMGGVLKAAPMSKQPSDTFAPEAISA